MKSLFLQKPAVLDSPLGASPRPDAFYQNAHAHLLDELRWLNRLLAAHVLRLRRVNFYDTFKDFRGFFAADEEIDALLAAEVYEDAGRTIKDKTHREQIAKLLAQAQQWREAIAARSSAAIAQNVFLPLIHLARCFHLSEFEQQALVICLAPQIDARYEKLYAYLQNDLTKKLPSIDLILDLLYQDPEDRLRYLTYFHPSLPLRHFHLVESVENESGTSAAQRSLRANWRIIHYVLGNQAVDERLIGDLRFFPPLDWQKVVIPEALKNRLQVLFQLAVENPSGQRPIIYLHGRSGVGKKTLARALCGDVELMMLVVNLQRLVASPETLQAKVRLVLREGLLQPAAIFFDHVERLETLKDEYASLFDDLIQEIADMGWITFLGSENPLPSALLELSAICPVEIPRPGHEAQNALWKVHLDGELLQSEMPSFDRLTASFDLTGGQIALAVRRARQSALARDPEQGEVNLADLMANSRIESQPRLTALARKIEPQYCWRDLVLPDEQMQQLCELSNQVKHRSAVMVDWGFANKLSLGRGLNALFAGPSGTGKTMAAEVIANDLGLDLYKIDLSAVVSKYIGETEKNLSRVFTEAEHSNAILFFDEADALFGKRSEVKDAHDRYANIEIAYLLQKMEEYEGITILATNLRKNIDEAFTRRIRFIIEFPLPEEEYRRRIWQGIWPQGTPLAPEVDLGFMSRQFKFAGGNIRNIALTAAFYAADNGKAVGMKHLILATKREYQKMAKLCMKSEFGEYYELLNPKIDS